MTDNTPLWQYALGCIGFTTAFLALPLAVRAIGERISRRVDQRINLHVHQALHPNVRVLPKQRSAR